MIVRFFPLASKFTAVSIVTITAILFCLSCRTVEKPMEKPVVRAPVPATENLLPSDTMLFLTMPDCAKFRTTMHESPTALFWNDPAMKSFHDKFVSRWNGQFAASLERDLNLKLGDVADWPQGQFTIAVTQNGWNGQNDQDLGLLLLLDTRENSSLLKTNLDALRKKWRDGGKPIRTEIVRGVSFSVMPLSSNDIPAVLTEIFPKRQPVQELGKEQSPPAKPNELVVGQFQSLLIVGNSLKAIEPVVAHLTGGAAPKLADNPIFDADKATQLRDDPLYYGWFNAKDFFRIVSQIPPAAPNPNAPTLLPSISPSIFLNASGLMGLQSASFTHRESRDGAQTDFYLSVPETARQGLLKIISVVPKEVNPPAFVPADTVKFSRWRLDGRKTWDELQKILADISPASLNSLNAVLNMANASAQLRNPGFDLRKDLIGNLGDDIINYDKTPAGSTPEQMNAAPSLFLFSAVNPDQTAFALKNVMALMFGQMTTPEPRDFLGRKIYSIPLPQRRIPGQTTPVSRSYYCASGNGYVAVTTDVPILEAFLRSSQSRNPLREIPGFMDAAQHVGGAGSGMLNYENRRVDVQNGFALLKVQSPNQIAGLSMATGVPVSLVNLMLVSPSVRSFCAGLDFSSLPDFDPVSKYFGFTVSGCVVTADGITFKTFTPRPPQLN